VASEATELTKMLGSARAWEYVPLDRVDLGATKFSVAKDLNP
jgi:hypothetical protein